MIDRIAILGGSSVYTPEFILSIISHNLNIREIVLYGQPGRKLDLVASFSQRILDRSGFPATVIASTDLAEAVSGAKYVLNHIRVGGMKGRLRDEKVPPKLGMVGDETLGAGGFANAMRTLPVVLEFADVIERTNPECTFINLTNPMGIIMEALIRHTKLNALGVCDLPAKYIKKIALILNRAPRELAVDFIGLNHMGWIQDIKLDGRSVISSVLDKIEQSKDDGFDCALINLFRMIPTRATSYFFHQDEVLRAQQTCGRYRAEVLFEAEQLILKLYEDDHLCDIPELTRERNAIWYEETIIPLIMALESSKMEQRVLCVKNDGCIRDLPDDSSVEVMAEVGAGTVTPHKVGSCPKFLGGLFQSVKQSDRLTVEAARHRSYEYALQALAINPLVPSVETAQRFLDKLIKDEKLELH